jgi:hypothetical protein
LLGDPASPVVIRVGFAVAPSALAADAGSAERRSWERRWWQRRSELADHG